MSAQLAGRRKRRSTSRRKSPRRSRRSSPIRSRRRPKTRSRRRSTRRSRRRSERRSKCNRKSKKRSCKRSRKCSWVKKKSSGKGKHKEYCKEGGKSSEDQLGGSSHRDGSGKPSRPITGTPFPAVAGTIPQSSTINRKKEAYGTFQDKMQKADVGSDELLKNLNQLRGLLNTASETPSDESPIDISLGLVGADESLTGNPLGCNSIIENVAGYNYKEGRKAYIRPILQEATDKQRQERGIIQALMMIDSGINYLTSKGRVAFPSWGHILNVSVEVDDKRTAYVNFKRVIKGVIKGMKNDKDRDQLVQALINFQTIIEDTPMSAKTQDYHLTTLPWRPASLGCDLIFRNVAGFKNSSDSNHYMRKGPIFAAGKVKSTQAANMIQSGIEYIETDKPFPHIDQILNNTNQSKKIIKEAEDKYNQQKLKRVADAKIRNTTHVESVVSNPRSTKLAELRDSFNTTKQTKTEANELIAERDALGERLFKIISEGADKNVETNAKIQSDNETKNQIVSEISDSLDHILGSYKLYIAVISNIITKLNDISEYIKTDTNSESVEFEADDASKITILMGDISGLVGRLTLPIFDDDKLCNQLGGGNNDGLKSEILALKKQIREWEQQIKIDKDARTTIESSIANNGLQYMASKKEWDANIKERADIIKNYYSQIKGIVYEISDLVGLILDISEEIGSDEGMTASTNEVLIEIKTK